MQEDNRRATTRRAFLRDSLGAALIVHPALGILDRHAGHDARAGSRRQVSTLKTESQYQVEGSQFDTAFREISEAMSMPASDDDRISIMASMVDRSVMAL